LPIIDQRIEQQQKGAPSPHDTKINNWHESAADKAAYGSASLASGAGFP